MESQSQAATTPIRIGRVTLAVRELERVADFYRSALGLQDVARGDDRILLGVGDDGFLQLLGRPTARVVPGSASGLFHTAFLLPTRGDLGRWLEHAASIGLQLEGASDHGVSEAVYLSDPEDNGIEVYVDRPREEWPIRDGGLQMTTQRLSLPDVLQAAGSTSWTGVPTRTHVGHVHLRVGDLSAATRFYRDVLGLELMVQLPSAAFLSSGGYHHHIAANVWHSRGSGLRAHDEAGLASIEWHARDPHSIELIAARAHKSDAPIDSLHDGISLSDPAGNRVEISHRG